MGIHTCVGLGGGIAEKDLGDRKGPMLGHDFVQSKLAGTANLDLTQGNFSPRQIVGRRLQPASVDASFADGSIQG